jgi:hypothetical protein
LLPTGLLGLALSRSQRRNLTIRELLEESGLRIDTIVEEIEVFVEMERCFWGDLRDPIFPLIRQPIENSDLVPINIEAISQTT